MVLLDHLTRSRAMLGVGPGAPQSDAFMLGIDPLTQRAKMDEALGIIVPHFQGSLVGVELSNRWARDRAATMEADRLAAVAARGVVTRHRVYDARGSTRPRMFGRRRRPLERVCCTSI